MPAFADAIPEQALALAVDLAEQAGTGLTVVGMDIVPEQTPLDHPEAVRASRRRSETHLGTASHIASSSVVVTGDTLVGHDLRHMVHREVNARDAKRVVLTPTADGATLASALRNPLYPVVRSVECDAVVVNRAERLDGVNSILVPVAGGPHSGVAVDVAKQIAVANGAWLDLFHVVDPDASEREVGQQYIDAALERTGDYENVDTWLHEAPDVSDAIIEQSDYYDLTVLGSPRKGRLRQFIFGSTTDAVRGRARSTVVTVRAKEPEQTWLEYWPDRDR